MKVKVLTQFHDKDNYAHIYEVGEIIEFDDTRANSLISRKLVKSVESAEQKETKSEAEVATSQGVAPKPKDDVKDVPTDTPNANEAEVADNADNAEKAKVLSPYFKDIAGVYKQKKTKAAPDIREHLNEISAELSSK